MFFVSEPWSGQMSKSRGLKYYFCMSKDGKRCSEFNIPSEAVLDMISAYKTRVMWSWGDAANAIFDGRLKKGISKADMEKYVARNIINR